MASKLLFIKQQSFINTLYYLPILFLLSVLNSRDNKNKPLFAVFKKNALWCDRVVLKNRNLKVVALKKSGGFPEPLRNYLFLRNSPNLEVFVPNSCSCPCLKKFLPKVLQPKLFNHNSLAENMNVIHINILDRNQYHQCQFSN